MADLTGPQRPSAQRVLNALEYALNHGLVASVAVLFCSIGLAALHLDLQYVVGGLVLVFAKRLATKRIAPVIRQPEPQKSTLSPRTQRLFPQRDPIAEALDDYSVREEED